MCTEVERRSLSFSRNLEKYRDHGMSWIAKVLERLPPRLAPLVRLQLLTFVSSIGMIQNGDFVNYNHLRMLLIEMSQTVNQEMLQKWLILSKFTLPKVFNMLIWKLHEDIQYRLGGPQQPRHTVKERRPVASEEQPFEDV